MTAASSGEPPGMRAAGVIRWAILVLVALLAGFSWTWPHVGSARAAVVAATYACPMHPSVVAHAPGTCPICHMALVAISDDGADDAVVIGEADAKAIGLETSLVGPRVVASPLHLPGIVTVPPPVIEHAHTEGASMTDTVVGLGEWEVHAPIAGVASSSRREGEHVRVGDELGTVTAGGRTVRVLSPGAGVLTLVSVTKGTWTPPGTMLFDVVDPQRLFALVTLSAATRPIVHVGDRGRFTTANDVVAGQVEEIFASVDDEAHSARARIAIDNTHETLEPGGYGTFEIAQVRRVLLLPRSSVVTTSARRFVFAELAPGRYVVRDVTVLADRGDVVEAEGDVEPGQRVVSAATFLVDAQRRLREARRQ